MCGTIACVAWDGLIIVGLILLVLWILAITDVLHIGMFTPLGLEDCEKIRVTNIQIRVCKLCSLR